MDWNDWGKPIVLWGLGTGRCGTKSLATQLKGVHEPGGLEVMPYLRRGEYGLGSGQWAAMINELQRRRDSDVPIVVDPRHSYVIPLIREIDREALFLWLYRDPVACIESWLARGNWEAHDPLEARYHPRGGYPEGWQRLRKGIWFWKEINGLIRRDLLDSFEVWRCPDDLVLKENENTAPAWASCDRLTPGEWADIELATRDQLAELDYLRRETRGRVI